MRRWEGGRGEGGGTAHLERAEAASGTTRTSHWVVRSLKNRKHTFNLRVVRFVDAANADADETGQLMVSSCNSSAIMNIVMGENSRTT